MNERESGKKRTYEENSKFILDRIQEALGEYQNKSGGEDPLHICVLLDCRRFVLKTNEEIQKLRDDVEVKDLEMKQASLNGAQELATRIKSYLNIDRPGEEELVSFDDIEFLIKEMKEEML